MDEDLSVYATGLVDGTVTIWRYRYDTNEIEKLKSIGKKVSQKTIAHPVRFRLDSVSNC